MLHLTLTALLAAATLSTALPSTPLPQILTEKDIIVFGSNGQVEVMKRDKFRLLSRDLYSSTPESLTSFENITSKGVPAKKLTKRCSSEQIFTLNPDQVFLNWDVPMSSVVKGTGDTTSVSVTQGYSLSNSLTVSESVDFVAKFLSASFGISYTETWQTSYSSAYTFQIPNGKYGVIVSNPSTTRKSGHVDVGCIAQATQTVQYQADSYQSKSYGGLGWVEGTISLCVGDEYPVKRCTGQGTLS